MAQLLLTAASSVGRVGAAVGLSLGRSLASSAGSYAAGAAERLIFGPRKRKIAGPRLETLQLQASTEGAGIARVFGRARVAGQFIWSSRFHETTAVSTESSGKGGRLGTRTTTTEYLYSISLAIGLCEGVIDRVGRVWADGKPFDMSRVNARVYQGTEDQLADAGVAALEGADAPAFRGLAYVVFEDLPLKDFGNRIPQFSFEIIKSLRDKDGEALENALTAVSLIPGSGEFALGTTKVLRQISEGRTVAENAHNSDGSSDIEAALDALLSEAPNLKSVSLVVAWFGTDLRAGTCEIRPGVETATKATTPYEWRAGGVDRAGAHVVSLDDGAPAYGGTPSDRSVVEAIGAIRARGLEVMLHPFILMDIPSGNGLPDPYGAGEQARYPWRGRVTVGASDKSAAAAPAVAHFFGTAGPAHFSVSGSDIVYSGPAEWSLRRFVLHMAKLASLAGGVDRFLMGSELRGITTARSDASDFPAVAAMKALAADVRAILGSATKISYAADWSEYFGHQPPDGSGDVYFHLDALWADSNVDFVGIDNYLPLADWRQGSAHRDFAAGWRSPYERDYLRANVEAGERYDFYYASEADRAAQARSPITDDAYGEPWVFRPKAFREWWTNAHYDRPAGVRSATPTAWIPESKPILFTEAGCPAVDKGANAPNLFIDPKSAESGLPPFSTGARDDLAQRRFLEALLSYWRDPAKNPISSVYGASMIDGERTHVWAYDARPYPFFPALSNVWGDAANWERGHWLNGRLARAPLDALVTALAAEAGVAVDASGLEGALGGYLLDRPASPREAIDPLADIFQFDLVEREEGLVFRARRGEADIILAAGDLVEREEGAMSVRLGDAADLPAAFRLGFLDEAGDYAPALVEAREPGAATLRETALDAPLVMSEADATARARAALADSRIMRASARFSLPPSRAEIEPGDVVVVEESQAGGGAPARWRLLEIADGAARRVEAVRAHPSAYEGSFGALKFKIADPAAVHAPPFFALMDLPLLAGETPGGARLAAFAEPWPGAIAAYSGALPQSAFRGTARLRATIGRLDALIGPAASGRWRRDNVRVRLGYGAFSSKSEDEVLAGANLLAVETAGGFELLKFKDAMLGSDGVWTLSTTLRGEFGTEDRAMLGAAAGARAVLVNAALGEIPYPAALRGLASPWRVGPDRDGPQEASFGEETVTLTDRSLRPLAPVHLRAEIVAGGLRLAFIRRTRVGEDDFDVEAPLGEAYERYRLRVFDGGVEKRVLDFGPPFAADPYDRPNILYTDAMILADFGAGGIAGAADPEFEIRQLCDLAGEGLPARRSLR